MEEKVKIVAFELENVKRVSMVRLAPNDKGLTVIGGKNAQGKTSILDGILFALGGERHRPSTLQHDGTMADARMSLKLSNGLLVERKGKKATLTVTDPTGKRAGQTLLNSFIEELAINLPKFMAKSETEKAEQLLLTLGIGPQLEAIQKREQEAYDKRHQFGIVADQKKKYAAEMPEYHDVPDKEASAADLINKSSEILRENQRVRERQSKLSEIDNRLVHLRKELATLEADKAAIEAGPVGEIQETAQIEEQIKNIDNTNAKIRANKSKEIAQEEAEEYSRQYDKMSEEVEKIRTERRALLDNANLPLPELSIGKNSNGRPILLYNNKAWDCMSSMEQIRVATAIIKGLKPECGFLLLDKLEMFDAEQLTELNNWLEAENLQAIGTRVTSRTDDCTIVIEDGYAVDESVEPIDVLEQVIDDTKTEPEQLDW
jgi:hypothetical protein